MKMRGLMLLWLAMAGLSVLPSAVAQSQAIPGDSPSSAKVLPSAGTTHPPLALTNTRPTEKTKLHNYFFDTLGPYPIVGAALSAGINQWDGAPPEWKQGAEGYGRRFASNFAIAGVSTTTRYALAKAFTKTRCITAVSAKASFRG